MRGYICFDDSSACAILDVAEGSLRDELAALPASMGEATAAGE